MTRSKGFSDKARELGVTRQAVQQAERAAAGRCSDCAKKAVKDKVRCKACLKARADAARDRRKEKKS